MPTCSRNFAAHYNLTIMDRFFHALSELLVRGIGRFLKFHVESPIVKDDFLQGIVFEDMKKDWKHVGDDIRKFMHKCSQEKK